LQFLTIPKGAGLSMPDGTKYADFANTHNYLIANGFKQPSSNNAWGAAAPGPGEGPYDSLYPEHGSAWHKTGLQPRPDGSLKGPIRFQRISKESSF
jgi:hypothetical protein